MLYNGYMITVYSTNTCAYCKQVKQYLTKKGKEFSEVDLDENPAKRQELYLRTNIMIVPITEIDGQLVVGYNLGKLAKLI